MKAAVATQDIARFEKALHDVSSPLSTLRGYLELGQMMNDEASLRSAVEGSLRECTRVFEQLKRMREQLRTEAMGAGR